MRFGFISLVLALGSAGLAGCGSGGGSLGPTDSHPNDGTYESVPSIDTLPASINPTTYTPPPGSYDAPPGQENAGGIGVGATIDSVCAELCSDVLGLGCTVTGDSFTSDPGNGENTDPNTPSTPPNTIAVPAECASACVQAEAKEPCPNELASAFSCILDHVELTCDLLKDTSDQETLDQQLAVTCQTALLAYTACRDGQPQAQEPPPQDTCTPNSCARCADACERCLCQQDGDASACTMMCS